MRVSPRLFVFACRALAGARAVCRQPGWPPPGMPWRRSPRSLRRRRPPRRPPPRTTRRPPSTACSPCGSTPAPSKTAARRASACATRRSASGRSTSEPICTWISTGTLDANAKLGIVRRGPCAWRSGRVSSACDGGGDARHRQPARGSFANSYAPVTLLPVAAAVTLLGRGAFTCTPARRCCKRCPPFRSYRRRPAAWRHGSNGGRPRVAACGSTPERRAGRRRRKSTSASRSAGACATWRCKRLRAPLRARGHGGDTIMFDGAVVFP